MIVDFRSHRGGNEGVTFLFKCEGKTHRVDYSQEMLHQYPRLFEEIMVTRECPQCNPEVEINGRRRSLPNTQGKDLQ